MTRRIAAALLALTFTASAQQTSSSTQLADTILRNSTHLPNQSIAYNSNGGWKYEVGTMLDGLTALYQSTHDARYRNYIQQNVDALLTTDGHVRDFKADAHSLDNVELGRAAIFLFRETHDPRYKVAADQMRAQLDIQPRAPSGGFWHKQIYPNQMWLDGAYMAEPFYAAYAGTFHQPKDFDDIAHQLLLMDQKMRDPKSGLMYHGYDESRQMPWASKTTGLSPEVWARAMGWYAMALVDTLEWFPKNHPKRADLIADLNRTAAAIVRVQDSKLHLWHDVLSHANTPENYPEASASCMFAYALAKGTRLGWLPPKYKPSATSAWAAIQQVFLIHEGNDVHLAGTVSVSGLGGTPYRSGDYNYYVRERVATDDLKGLGAFLLAGSEMDRGLFTRLSPAGHKP